MKKTLVALAVMAFAGSANAGIEIFNKDGVSVNLKGDIEVVYVKGTAKDSELTQEIQDADFGFDVRYAVNDDLQFGGYWEFDGASKDVTLGNDSITKVGDAYVALYSKSLGSFKFGRTCGALDDAGIGSDYQFGVNAFFQNDSDFCGDEAIRYDIDKGNFYATAAIIQDKKDKNKLGVDGSYFDAKAGYRVADFDFTAYFGSADLAKTAQEETLLGLEGRFAGIENVELAVAYYKLDGDITETDTIALTATYSLDKLKLAAGFSTTDAGADDVANYYVNAGYGIAPSTTAYVELGGNDADNSELGLAFGVKASF
ncbi:TPA: porin [Vibrio vulnificus]|nr:porin [Vibrio vulnificus]